MQMKQCTAKRRRYPQYVLMLDLLMMMLFVLVQADYSMKPQGITYVFSGEKLPQDCIVLWYQPPEPTKFFDPALSQWQAAAGVVDPAGTIFVKNVDARRFLEEAPMPAEDLLIGIVGALAEDIRKQQFALCAAGYCHTILVEIDQSGKAVLHKN